MAPIATLILFLTALTTLTSLISPTTATFFYPNPASSIIEYLLVDTHGAYRSGFADAITPCTNYVSGAQTLGRTTAAQWLRVAFHDFVTADVEAGVGGVDASIGFETLREENSGSAFNDSFTFWRGYVSSKVAMADLVALGTVVSVGNCGGPQIPMRGGRVDATGGGGEGVPAPDTDLPTTLGFFSRAGFNQADSIALTACGHTMGSVHHGGFPTVVGPEAVTPSNTAGGIHFDTTVAKFDPLVVHEYLNGTGNAGGPLVTSFNISSRSDLRLYESDNNATMITLGELGDGFGDACIPVMQRMIETVPRGVKLGDVVQPQGVKPVNASLDFNQAGGLVFTGYIRVLIPPSGAIPSSPIFLTTSHSSTPTPLAAEADTGNSIFGTTLFYPFRIPISRPEDFTSFTITIPTSSTRYKQHQGTYTFPVQSSIFIVPSLTSLSSSTNPSTSSSTVDFTIAVRPASKSYLKFLRRSDAVAPRAEIVAPVEQQGTLGPGMETVEVANVVKAGRKGGYELWSGSAVVSGTVTGAVSVEVWSGDGGEEAAGGGDLMFLGQD